MRSDLSGLPEGWHLEEWTKKVRCISSTSTIIVIIDALDCLTNYYRIEHTPEGTVSGVIAKSVDYDERVELMDLFCKFLFVSRSSPSSSSVDE